MRVSYGLPAGDSYRTLIITTRLCIFLLATIGADEPERCRKGGASAARGEVRVPGISQGAWKRSQRTQHARCAHAECHVALLFGREPGWYCSSLTFSIQSTS